MFRFWAGATAVCLIGSFGVSKVLAAEFGSSVAPRSSSPSTSAYFFAEASFSSRANSGNVWDPASDIGLAKADHSTAGAQTYTLVEFEPASSFGAAWSPMSIVANATAMTPPRLSDSRATADSYFHLLETLSRYGANGVRSASTGQPMR